MRDTKRIIFLVLSFIMAAAIIITLTLTKAIPPQSAPSAPLREGAAQALKLIDSADPDTAPDLAALLGEEGFTPLRVEKAFIDGGGCSRVIVYNTTDTAITSYELELIYFDGAGGKMGENALYTVENVYIGGRQEFGIDKYIGGGNGAQYIKAIIKGVLYADGNAWVNDSAETQAAIEGLSLDTDEYKKTVEKNADRVQSASENPYLFINKMTMTDADEISGRRDLKLVLTNTSETTIRDIKVAVAEFNRDNEPVDVSPQIYVGKNIRLASCKGMELRGGESRSFASSGFLEKDCFRINAIITEITFADGTVWKNPYATDWLLWFM